MTINLPAQLYTSDALASIALITILFFVRLLVGRLLSARDNLSRKVVRRWGANFRNFLLLVAVIGLVMIWAPQLRTFALSLTAVAIAVVVATKELILCLSGSALRTFSSAYSIGDIIEVDGTRGEVVSYNLLATRLDELEARDGSMRPTGRTVLVPHSLLFGSPIRVLEEPQEGVRHTFVMTFDPTANIFAEQSNIESVARKALGLFERERVKRGAAPIPTTQKHAMSQQLQISFGTNDIGKYKLDITVFTLTDLVQRTENSIACAIGDYVHQQAIKEIQK